MLPAVESSPYTSFESPRSAGPNVFHLMLAVTLGVVMGGVTTYCFVPKPVATQTTTAHTKRMLSLLTSQPVPCEGWEARCRAGADAAAAQGLGRFWPVDQCADGARLSCGFRAPAWASPSVVELPASAENHAHSATHVSEKGTSETLLVFLPGTGTATDKVHTLLSAAADMGHHVIGLSYGTALPLLLLLISPLLLLPLLPLLLLLLKSGGRSLSGQPRFRPRSRR